MTVLTAGRWWLHDAWLMAGRNTRRILRAPGLLLMYALIQPVTFILLFAYVFGGAIATPGGDYVQFLIPAIFVQMILFSSAGAVAVGLAEDMERGVMDRFRSLPMTRTSVLLGRIASESVRNVITLAVMVACGLLVGFRFRGEPGAIVLGFGLLLLAGFAFSWVAAFAGLAARGAEAAQGLGLVWLFPFTFVSSAFVPASTMPGWLRPYAENSPVTLLVETLRAWFGGRPAGELAGRSVAWCLGLILVFGALAVLRLRRAGR